MNTTMQFNHALNGVRGCHAPATKPVATSKQDACLMARFGAYRAGRALTDADFERQARRRQRRGGTSDGPLQP